MDPRVAALMSTAFLGRRFTRRQIDDIQQTVRMCPNDIRTELSKTICKALARMHEDAFHVLHRYAFAQYPQDPNWNRHRTFAVDGSKFSLPRWLVGDGCLLPNDGVHYLQGLLPCLYRLDNRMPVDFIPAPDADADERAAERTHFAALSPGDVAVFERVCFSITKLRAMTTLPLPDCPNFCSAPVNDVETDVPQIIIVIEVPAGHVPTSLISLNLDDALVICDRPNRRLGYDREAWTTMAAASMRAEDDHSDSDPWR